MTAPALRLFVAVRVPDEVRGGLRRAQAEAESVLAPGCVRWAREGQFHLTLKFLGLVGVGDVEPLVGSLENACSPFGPLELESRDIGFFPNARSPRVVWASVHDASGQLASLQQAIEQAVRPFSREESEARFTAHVTLGRCAGIARRQADRLGLFGREMTGRVFGRWTAGEIELIRSEPGPGGARHSTLAGIPLAGRAASGTLPPR